MAPSRGSDREHARGAGAGQLQPHARALVGDAELVLRVFERIGTSMGRSEGGIPVEMVRALLREEALPQDFRPNWRFYDLDRPGAAQD